MEDTATLQEGERRFEDLAAGEEFCWKGDPHTVWVKHLDHGGHMHTFSAKGGGVVYYNDIPGRLTIKPPQSKYIKATFSFDEESAGKGDLTFTGWHDPHDKWNGWCKPLLPQAEVDKLVRLFKQYHQDEPGETYMHLSWRDDVLCFTNGEPLSGLCDEELLVQPQIIQADGGDQTVWECGFGIVWDDYSLDTSNWLVINETDPQPVERQSHIGRENAIDCAITLVADLLRGNTQFLGKNHPDYTGEIAEITMSCEDGIDSGANESWIITIQKL